MLSPRLVLVRHGQSTWNADGLLQGQADPPLSDRGRAEAAALAPALAGFPSDRVIASDLVRARETAELAGHEAPALDPRWREVGVGEWQGRPLAELPPGPEPSWRGGSLVPPGGETWEQMATRVGQAVDELRARGGAWLVVCHGGTIRAAVAHVTGADARHIAGPANGSVTVLGLDDAPALPAQLHAFAWTPDGEVPGL